MPRNDNRIGIAALLTEVVVIFLAPTGFLIWYVGSYGAAASSIPAHFELIILGLLATSALRMLLGAIKTPKYLARLASCILISALIITIWLYYALAIGGSHYWGRIVSLEIIKAYSGHQLIALLQAVGISLTWAAALAAAVVVTFILACWLWLSKFDWVAALSKSSSSLFLAVVSLSILGIVFSRALEYVGYPPLLQQEPVAVSFFEASRGSSLQGLRIDSARANHLNQLADIERRSLSSQAAESHRNIILIVVDGLRPDRMGVLEPELKTTPFLSKLLEQEFFGILGGIHAVCAESACGLLATASSAYPHEFTTRPITLGEILKLNGYDFHLLLSGDHAGFYGLKDKYGPYDSYVDGGDFSGYINDDRGLLPFIDDLEQWSGNPTFFQFHLMSAHNLGRRWPEANIFEPARSYALAVSREPENAMNFYDNGIYQTDLMIEKILTRLEEKNYLTDSIVVITSDHGEMLGEHNHWLHANTVYESALRIPFLMIPAWGNKVDNIQWVSFGSQVDIAPTILGELGIQPPSTWSGAPIQEGLSESVVYFRQSGKVGLVERDDDQAIWKYWNDMNSRREYVFNLSLDPEEKKNLVEKVDIGRLDRWRLLTFRAAGSIGSQMEH